MKFVGFSRWKKWFLWGAIITQLIVNLATVIQILIQCEHVSSLWDSRVKGRCWSPKIQAATGFFQGAWNSTTDLALTLLPILILKSLNMKTSTRAALGVVMGMSVFAMIAAIVKTIELQYIGERDDFTWDTVIFVIWFSVENYVVIISASVPTIRPLILWIWKKKEQRSQTSAQKLSA